MNKLLILENLLIISTIILALTIILPYFIPKIQRELTSKEMKDEIIRQLKEKEGMTIEDYLIKQYFERMMEEMG